MNPLNIKALDAFGGCVDDEIESTEAYAQAKLSFDKRTPLTHLKTQTLFRGSESTEHSKRI